LRGILLDTHALYWLVSGSDRLAEEALLAIGESQEVGALYVSPITAWELSLAAAKPAHQDRPDLGDGSPAHWFREAVKATAAKIIPIRQRIALEASEVVYATGPKDPGDCFLVATARVRGISLVTRDRIITRTAGAIPGYLDIIPC
jgi:PIN domain nuclease of toxin-antitoxin system